MPEEEQELRMERMQKQISKHNVFKWSNSFLTAMKNVKINLNLSKRFENLDRISVLDKYQHAGKCLLLLDYDGTLSELQSHPDLAYPNEHLKVLLKELSHKSKNELCIISGRTKQSLEEWFGDLKATLVAEHGIFFKRTHWENLLTDTVPWKEDVKRIMQQFSDNCANTFVEEKSSSLSWHYRQADPETSLAQSRELINLLSDFLISSNANILDGHKVIEVKPVQAGKGYALKKLFDFTQYDCCICIGDDKTDEEMFDVVNAVDGITIKVGKGHSIAKHRFDGVSQVLSFLSQLR